MFPIDPVTCGFKSKFMKPDEHQQEKDSNEETIKIDFSEKKAEKQRDAKSDLNKMTILSSLIKMSDEVCMDEEDETNFLNELESILLCNTMRTHEQYNESNLSLNEKKCQIEIKNKEKEKIQVDPSINKQKKQVELKESSLNKRQKEDNLDKEKKQKEMNSISVTCSNSTTHLSNSSTSSSSSTLATSPYSTTSPSMNSVSMNNLDSDANPRKHSPSKPCFPFIT